MNTLAEPLIATLRQLREAQSDAIDYRDAYIAALGLLHQQHHELVQLRAQNRRLVDEFRAYRTATICEPAA